VKFNRRSFLKISGAAGASLTATPSPVCSREAHVPPDPFGCLVDITRCNGCRKCEEACSEINKLYPPDQPFNLSNLIFDIKRRPDEKAYTVVNRYFPGKLDEQGRPVPLFVKIQCMHCQDAACVSACLTGALTKKENGAVHYDVTKCIGCRYCMVACPFEIPAYEYFNPVTPQIRKCTFCFDTISKENGIPACAKICNVEAITFGKRNTLLKLAKKRLMENPGKYINRIFGEKEAGGTSWLYISPVPYKKIGFPAVPDKALPGLSERIQHALFSYLWSPLVLFGILGGIMYKLSGKSKEKQSEGDRDGT